MENVTVLWSVGAAAALVLAVLCGLMWLMERRDLAGLMLCLLGVATAASAYFELGMMHAATPAEYGEWLRWYHLPVFLALMAQIVFIHCYLGTSSAWLMWAVIAARSFVFVVNFLLHPNYHFSRIDSLRTMPLFGDQVSVIGAAVQRRELQWFAVASIALLLAYIVDAAVRHWRKGGAESRRKALAVGLAIALPLLCTVLYTQLLAFGIFRGAISNIPWFLGALSMMAYVSGRDFILNQRARLELAELRGQLAQVERVNLLGQLALALAHELSQPLSAISLNLAAARKQLKRARPGEDIGAILDDIGADGDRAIETIDRMRRLFKQRAIELNPIRLDEVVRDAVALVSAEANARRVILRWLVQPGLPPVLGDRIHLSQVLLNLLVNAIQAVQSRPVDARFVAVEAWSDEVTGGVEISVKDSGPGIPDAILDRIFHPLFTTKPEGMGMGLALSHAIIKAHGGRLWAENLRQAEGAVFRLTLQRA